MKRIEVVASEKFLPVGSTSDIVNIIIEEGIGTVNVVHKRDVFSFDVEEGNSFSISGDAMMAMNGIIRYIAIVSEKEHQETTNRQIMLDLANDETKQYYADRLARQSYKAYKKFNKGA